MTTNPFVALSFTVLICIASARSSVGDTFGSGANTFDIEFVTIGNPDNVADTDNLGTPLGGSVPYSYRIGKYEVSEEMIDKANALGGLGIAKDALGPDKPATSVNWNEAARFVNWLNMSTGGTPAYKFATQPGETGYSANSDIELWTISDAGYNPINPVRNSLARYFLPHHGEWYKAAYYNPISGVYYDYPTGSDSRPDGIDSAKDTNFEAVINEGYNQGGPNDITNAGNLSPYGTMGQGGNVAEFLEGSGDIRLVAGGSWGSSFHDLIAGGIYNIAFPTEEFPGIGFRVASIPEPNALLLVAFSTLGLLWRRRAFK